jgi:hypothetical protein
MGAEVKPPLAEILKRKQGRRFDRVRHDGKDPAQVDAFLVAIASGIEGLEAELDRLRATPEVSSEGTDLIVPPPAPEEESEGSAERIGRIGAVMEREIEQMLADARAQAATTESEAREEADRIRNDAKDAARLSIDEARSFLTQAERDAEEMQSGVAERRRQLMEDFQKMKEVLERVTQALRTLLDGLGPDPAG